MPLKTKSGLTKAQRDQKWFARREHARRAKRRKRGRRPRPRSRGNPQDLTNMLLMQLLGQIRGRQMPTSMKHGSNVVSGYAGTVAPDRLAPVWSRDERGLIHQEAASRTFARHVAQHLGRGPA